MSEQDPAPNHGEAPAWEDFLGEHLARIERVVRRVCRDEDEAADVAAEVLERFHLDWPALLGKYRPEAGSRFESWLAVVTRNAAIDALRRRQGASLARSPGRVVPLEPDEHAARDKGPLAAALAKAASGVIAEILAGLSGDERALLRLYFLEGRSAESLRIAFGGRTRSQVYNRVHTLTGKLTALARRAGLSADDAEHLARLDWGRLLEEPE